MDDPREPPITGDDSFEPLHHIELSDPDKPESPPSRARLWLVRLAWTLGICLLFGLFVYALDPIGWAAETLLVYESPRWSAQVVVISTLGEVNRAVRLHRVETIQRILIARGPIRRYENADPPISEHVFIRQALVAAGVPEEAVDALPHQPESMLEEQRMLRDWMLTNGVGSFIQFTPYYHSRYWKMKHDHTFAGLGIEAQIHPLRNNRPIWRKQALAIQNMLIRAVFWRLVYLPIIRSEAEGLTHLSEAPVEDSV